MILLEKKYQAFDIEDVEKNVSRIVGRDVKIDEIDIEIYDDSRSKDFNIMAVVDGEPVLVYDDNGELVDEPFKEINFGEYGLDVKYIFNFDVSLFHSYVRYNEL